MHTKSHRFPHYAIVAWLMLSFCLFTLNTVHAGELAVLPKLKHSAEQNTAVLPSLDATSPLTTYAISNNIAPISAGIAYQSASLLMNDIGAWVAPGQSTLLEMRQSALGAYLHWCQGSFRFTVTAYFLNRSLSDKGSRIDSHSSGGVYAQSEYEVQPDWILYGRVDGNSAPQNNAFTPFSSQHIHSRTTGGARHALSQRQNLALEFSRVQLRNSEKINQLAAQWSTILP